MSTLTPRLLLALTFVGTAPFTMGAKGGCGTFNSKQAAPDVTGNWAISYDPKLEVDVKIGGAVYHQTLASQGGSFTFNHAGKPYTFNLDCSRPEVICPSEVWPNQVAVDQRDETYRHRMWVEIPVQECAGKLVQPARSECGAGTLNPDCKPVCDGEVTTKQADAFGLIREGGVGFDLFLGAGVASDGVNCALLGVSYARADLVNVGEEETPGWKATEMANGQVKTAYAGGCLWAGDIDQDGKPEALVLGATVEVTTHFSGDRL